MLYSEMSEAQRQLLFDNPENYPLRVRFLRKSGLVTADVIVLLRREGIDFEVDDAQIEEIMTQQGYTGPMPDNAD